jgi:integrase
VQIKGDGRRRKYVAQPFDHKGNRLTRGFDRKIDCIEWEAKIRVRTQRILEGLEIAFDPITFGEFAEEWKRSRKKGKKSSWAGEVTKLDNVWLKKFGHKLMNTITKKEIADELDGLIEQGLSPAYRNRHRAMLHKMWEDARDHEPPYVSTNPLSKIPLLKEPESSPNQGLLRTREDALKFIEAYGVHGPSWKVACGVMAFAGLRVDEMVALKFEDLDFERSTIAVSKTWDIKTKRIVHRTKGMREGGTEHVLMLPELRAILLEWKALTLFRRPQDFVVPDTRGKHLTYWKVKRIHDLVGFRHFCGVYLRALGFQGDDLKGLMRHSDSKTTERYSPIDMRHLLERATKLGIEVGNRASQAHLPPSQN